MQLRDERGDVAVEAVLVAPVLILLIFTVIQFALWYHASSVSRSAAQEGVRVERVAGATARSGQDATNAFLHQTAGSLLHDTAVTSTRTVDVAMVSVDGTVTAVVPGLHLHVAGKAEGTVEHFRGPTP